MKFEEAIKLLKEGEKIYLSRPGYSVGQVIYYIDRHEDVHKLTWDDDKQKWFDSVSTYFTFNVDDLFSDEREIYKRSKKYGI